MSLTAKVLRPNSKVLLNTHGLIGLIYLSKPGGDSDAPETVLPVTFLTITAVGAVSGTGRRGWAFGRVSGTVGLGTSIALLMPNNCVEFGYIYIKKTKALFTSLKYLFLNPLAHKFDPPE